MFSPFDKRPGSNVGWYFDSETGSLAREDVFPSCRAWVSQNQGSTSPFDTGELGSFTFDTLTGYPVGLPTGKSVATLVLRDIQENWDGASGTGDGPILWDGGDWDIRWDGTGTVSAQFSCPYTSSSANQMVVNLTPSSGGVLVKIEASDPTDPVRNIRMVRAAQVEKSKHFPWRDRFLERIRLGSRARLLNPQRINYSLLTDWANRARLGTYSWTSYERGGWPVEVQVHLANEAKRDAWIHIPHGANDAYVTALAEYIKANLDPRLKWWVELSNEPWNDTFQSEPITGHLGQALYFRQQGAAAGLDVGGTQPFTGQAKYFGRRVRQVMQIVAGVFAGQMDRVERVYSGWLNNSAGWFWTETGLQFEDCYQNVEWACAAPYPGNQVGPLGSMTADQMLAGVRADMAPTFKDMRLFRERLATYGIKPVGYEGSQGLAGSGLTKAQSAVLFTAQKTAEMRRLTRDLHGETQYRWPDGRATIYSLQSKWASGQAFGHWQGEDGDTEKGLAVRAVAQAAPGGIRCQRGVASLGASAKTLAVTINAVDTAHAFVRVTNVHFHSTGPATVTTTNRNLVDLGATIELTNSTTVTITRETAGESVDYWVAWEVWQYEGDPSGLYEFTVRAQGQVDLASGTTEVRVDLSEPIDQPGRCIPFLQALSSDAATTTNWDSHLTTIDLDQSTREVVLRRSASACRTRASYVVVEFTGAGWTVNRWTHLFSAANSVETVTHPTVDWADTATFATHRIPAAESQLEDCGVLVLPNTTSQTLTARLRNGADNVAGGYNLVGFSLTSTALVVQHFSSLAGGGAFGSADTLKDVTFTAFLNRELFAVIGYADCAGTGTAHPTGSWHYWARTNQSLRFERRRSGQVGDWAGQVIALPSVYNPRFGADATLDWGGSAEVTLTVTPPGGFEAAAGITWGASAAARIRLNLAATGAVSWASSAAPRERLSLAAGATIALGASAALRERLGLAASVGIAWQASAALRERLGLSAAPGLAWGASASLSERLAVEAAGGWSWAGQATTGGQIALLFEAAGLIAWGGSAAPTLRVTFEAAASLIWAADADASLAIGPGAFEAAGDIAWSASAALRIRIGGRATAVVNWGGSALVTIGGVPPGETFVPKSTEAPPETSTGPAALSGPVDTMAPGQVGGLLQQFGPGGPVGAGSGAAVTSAVPETLTNRQQLERLAAAGDVVVLRANGQLFTRWQSVRIERSLGACCAAWSVQANSLSLAVLPVGQIVSLALGSDVVVEGYSERLSASLEGDSRTVTVEGRDFLQDLVDSTPTEGPWEYYGETVSSLASKLAAPFGVRVLAEALPGAVLPVFGIQPGETGWAVIERAARIRGLLVMSDGRRSLRLFRPGLELATTSLRQGVNIKSAQLEVGSQDRFGSVTVRGQAQAYDEWNAEQYTHPGATAEDGRVRPGRRLLVIAETQADLEACQNRANWEVAVRAARSSTLAVTVKGWRQTPGGPLWTPGLLVPTDIPALAVSARLLVESVALSFDAGSGGFTAELRLTRADAYLPEPVLDPAEEIGGFWWTSAGGVEEFPE